MSNFPGYLKMMILIAASIAAVIAVMFVWTGELPRELAKIAGTFGIIAAFGLLVNVFSLARKPDPEP